MVAPMKPRLTPTEIALKDLPPEGRDFTYSQNTEELNGALKDLIGSNPYEVAFRITPMGNTYDLRGTVRTYLNLDCSLCAMDFKYPVIQEIHEFLVVEKPLAKGDQLSKANHAHEWASEGPDCLMLDSEVFRVGDYIHEVIGLAEPIRPLGKPDCDINCENISETLRAHLQSQQNPPDNMRASPFRVLEKFKLKS